VKRWCWHLRWKVIWWISWKIQQLMAKLKVVHKWVGLSQVQSFMLILGRVGLGHFTCGSGWAGSRKLDPRPTLVWARSAVGLFVAGPMVRNTHALLYRIRDRYRRPAYPKRPRPVRSRYWGPLCCPANLAAAYAVWVQQSWTRVQFSWHDPTRPTSSDPTRPKITIKLWTRPNFAWLSCRKI